MNFRSILGGNCWSAFVDSFSQELSAVFHSEKDIVHAVKVSNVRPEIIRRFFGKFINEETEQLQMKGGAKAFYQKVVSKVPVVTNESYRTYKLSGLGSVIKLNMDVSRLTPPHKK